MKVQQEILDKVLALYKRNYRYLKEVDVDHPRCRGLFQLGTTEYCDALRHLTDVEAQLCLNQLCYVFFGQGILDQRFNGLQGLSLDDYLELRKEGMFVVESHKRFHRQTDPMQAFNGRLELMRIKKRGNIYVAKLDFDLNDGAATGNLSLVLKR